MKKSLHLFFAFSAAAICTLNVADGLMCYTCSYVSNADANQDLACIQAPTQLTNCTKKFCTIVRQERMSPAGKVLSFQRNCEDKPMFLDNIKEDATFKTFYRSCNTDLCNHSDGLRSISKLKPDVGNVPNMIIKGKPF